MPCTLLVPLRLLLAADAAVSCGSYRLLDMDGTLIDSTGGVAGAWEVFARKYPGLDVPTILGCTKVASSRPFQAFFERSPLQLCMV